MPAVSAQDFRSVAAELEQLAAFAVLADLPGDRRLSADKFEEFLHRQSHLPDDGVERAFVEFAVRRHNQRSQSAGFGVNGVASAAVPVLPSCKQRDAMNIAIRKSRETAHGQAAAATATSTTAVSTIRSQPSSARSPSTAAISPAISAGVSGKGP